MTRCSSSSTRNICSARSSRSPSSARRDLRPSIKEDAGSRRSNGDALKEAFRFFDKDNSSRAEIDPRARNGELMQVLLVVLHPHLSPTSRLATPSASGKARA